MLERSLQAASYSVSNISAKFCFTKDLIDCHLKGNCLAHYSAAAFEHFTHS